MDTAKQIKQSNDSMLPAQLAALSVGIPLPLHNKVMEIGEKSALARQAGLFREAGVINDEQYEEITESLGVTDLNALIVPKAEEYWAQCWKETTNVVGVAFGKQVYSLTDKPNASLLETTLRCFTALCAGKEGDTSMSTTIGNIRAGSDTILGELGKALTDVAKNLSEEKPEQAKEEEKE